MSELRIKALTLAVDACSDNDKVVPLAEQFYAFLSADGETKPATTRGRKGAADKGTPEADAGSANAGTAAGQDTSTTSTTATNTASPSDEGKAAGSGEAAQSTGEVAPTKDDVIKAATTFGAKHGEAKLTPVIQKYGERISAIDPSKYADLIADLSGEPAAASVFD